MKFLIIGGSGNVGRGIVKAINDLNYESTVIDPLVNNPIEDFPKEELAKLIENVNYIIYAAEAGNRDDYKADISLLFKNNQRFRNFCDAISRINHKLPIIYIGGTWTKRAWDENFSVHQDSENKDITDCNEYEQAKIAAEDNASFISAEVNIPVIYVDYITVVPNFSPNFSIYKMTESAINSGEIIYSPGDYGRPILNSTDAGKTLIDLVLNDKSEARFKKFLLPGIFIRFEEFAKAVSEVINQKLAKDIKLIEQKETPDSLKVKTKLLDSQVSKESELIENAKKALRDNVVEVMEILEQNKDQSK